VLHGESYLVNKKPIVIRDILGNTDSNAANNGETQNISSIVKGFVDKIKKLCDDELGPEKEDETNNNLELNKKSTNEKKLSIYMTYKQLYDRWKLGVTDNKTMKYENFRFFDSFYNDVSDEYMVNVDSFAALIRDVLDGHNDMSIYAFLWEICKMSNFNLLALPVNIYEALSSKEKMMEVFTPYTYMSVDNAFMDTTYIAMYTHKESSHLNITDPYNMYEDDGLDFLKNGIVNKTNKNVPVFGVTYSMGNQRIFNRITVNMDAPKVTAHSIMAELMISRQGANSGSQPIGFEGHDIFETYANKSYSCSVEMLGCAQIMPLMYFQLNNIPMFKGGYMITNVEHEISNGTMKTKFSGVRMNKNRFKISKDKQIFNENVLEAYLKNRKKGEDGGSGGSDGGGSSAGPHPKRGVYETRTMTDAVKVTNPNLNGVKYSKENTLIIIDAGHESTLPVPAKQSREFALSEIWDDKNAKYVGDVNPNEPYGIMNGLKYEDKKWSEAYSYSEDSSSSKGLSGKSRYLEYWGNRKLALKLKNKLEANGYKVAMATKNMGRTSTKENGYQNHVTKLWENNNKNAIVISFHSDAAGDGSWADANRWSIYCQHADEYIIKEKDWATCPPNADASYVLAANIIKAAKEKFTESELKEVFGEKINIKSNPQVYLASKGGIRPLTYTKPPAVMSENWFYTSKKGVEFLGSQKGEDLIVDVHYKGVQNFFDECNSLPKSVSTPEATQTPVDAEKAKGNETPNNGNNSTPLPAQVDGNGNAGYLYGNGNAGYLYGALLKQGKF
jgi:N-acetylmuramoyl-L-alanine amidase